MDDRVSQIDLRAEPALIAGVSQLIVTGESIGKVLRTILDESVQVCGAVRGFLAIVDHDRGELDVRYTAGDGWSEEKRLGRLKVSEETGRGITSHVAATGKPYNSPNVKHDPYYICSFDDVKSELAVPLVDSNQRTRGVLNIESTRSSAFNTEHEHLALALAGLAVIAMVVADHRSREAALVQIGKELNGFTDAGAIPQKVLDVAAEALSFEDCSLFMIDRASGKLVLRASRGALRRKIGKATYDLGEGLTGWTAQQKQAIRLVNPSSDPRWRGLHQELPNVEDGAFMAVPILGRSGLIGVLRVQRRKSPYKWFRNDFTEDEERILSTIAGQLAVALENIRLVDQLVKTERLAAWGEMSARSAHMIGNRVFAIKGDINEIEYILQSGEVEPADAWKLLGSIKNGIFLLEEILNEFREFVKATQIELVETDINELVRESIEESFPKRSATTLKLNLDGDIPHVSADPTKLKRCFSELMENAVSFQPEGGEIVVTTSLADARSKKWLKAGRQSGRYVAVRFEDTGPGVELENKPKIFNPFFTSRAKGMGLGLSIVKGIVDAHDGTIYESGTPGKGARFTILLPCAGGCRKPRRKPARSDI
jgi:signal transduction histidine kinase